MGVTLEAELTLRSILAVSRAAAQRHGIIRKSMQVFHDRSLLLRYFWYFVLPVLEYYSAADSHLNYWTLDRVVKLLVFQLAVFWTSTLLIDDLWQCNA